MLRNREVRRALIACLLVTAFGTVASYLITRSIMLDALGDARIVTASINEAASMVASGTPTANAALFAAICTLATGLIVTVIFMILTDRRYRALAKMAANLDRVLAGERDIRLRDMSEGELAILSSEIDKVIARLNLTVDELQAEKLALSDALADISHQLKTPLAVLKTQASVALASDDPQLWRESLQAMRTTLDGTIMLTERLLQLASVKGKEQGERAFLAVDLQDIVQNSCFSRITQARSKNIDLGYEGERSAVMIAGDGVLLAELCANLLDNAIRYTPANGTVTLSLRRDGEGVVMEVEDSGPGIEDDQIQQALLPFQRLENVGDNPGAGLGLALVTDIARLHRSHPQLLRSETLGGLKVRLRFLAAAPGRSEQAFQG